VVRVVDGPQFHVAVESMDLRRRRRQSEPFVGHSGTGSGDPHHYVKKENHKPSQLARTPPICASATRKKPRYDKDELFTDLPFFSS
jgi:hypothetical protein